MKNIFVLLYLIILSVSCIKEQETIQKKEIYSLHLAFEGKVSKDKKIPMVLRETMGETTRIHEGKVERRGGYSISFPKHSYEIDLKEDLDFTNLPADDDWILNANYI
ncbi:MAG: hypothetical protein AAFP82_21450, partial [Bacteroidota bacterium]